MAQFHENHKANMRKLEPKKQHANLNEMSTCDAEQQLEEKKDNYF